MKRWFNILRAALLMLLFGLLLFLTWILNTESGLRWTVEQAHPYLPGDLQLEQLRGRLSGPVDIATLSYRQDDGMALKIEQLHLDWSPSALLVGQLRFSDISAQRLTVDLPAAQPSGADSITALPRIAVPVSVALARLELHQIQIRRPEQPPISIDHLGLAASLHWDELKLKRLQLSALTARLEARGTAELSDMYRHDLSFNWQVEHTPVGRARGQATLKGDLDSTHLSHTLHQPISAHAELNLRDLLRRPHWEGQIKAEPFPLQALGPDLPQASLALDTRIQGDLQQQTLEGGFRSRSEQWSDIDAEFLLTASPDRIQVEQLLLRSPDDQRRVSLHGELQPQSKQGEFALAWHGIGWPLQGESQISSAHGSAYIKGGLEDYQWSLAGDLSSPHWNDSHLRGIGTGTLTGLDIIEARLLTLDGRITGPVKLDWAEGFSWQTTLTARGLDPGQRLAQLPGRINFKIDSKGDTQGGLSASLAIKQFDGRLQQRPVQLSGSLEWQDDTLSLHQLEFRSAESVVKADGAIGAQIQLDWQLVSPQLSQLHPDLEGSLSASGTLRGARATPLLQLQLSGQSLAWRNYAIGSIKANGEADLFRWQQVALQAHAQQLELAGQTLQSIAVDLNNEQGRQQLALQITHADAAIELHATGTLRQHTWHGQVHDVRITSPQFGDWAQRQAVELRLSEQQVVLQRMCLDSDAAHACLQIDYARQTWNAKLESTNFPLAVFSPLLKERMALSGEADFTLQASLNKQQQLRADGQVQLHPGSVDVRMLDNEMEHWDYQGGQANLSLNQDGLQASLQLTVTARDSLSVKAELPRFNALDFNPDTQPLKASASLKLDQLDLLQGMIYEARDIRGLLTLEASAHGTLGAPQVSGRLALEDGAMDIPRLGLHIKNINLKAEGNDRTLNYQLDAESGGGHVQARGETQLQPEAGWPTRIDISGKDLEVSSIPEARIDVSPELSIRIKGRRIDVEGTVRVPYAKLQPADISNAKLPSDDVRIEGAQSAPDEGWKIYSNIRLILSERVFLNGFGFEGRITGNVVLKSEPGKPTIGVGELSVVEGQYSAYGQRLEIVRGRLLFASSPLNNPGLDLRAVRRVQDVTAGVSVTGTLRNPKFDVFSNPAMGQTDALAYLLLGRPLEEGASSDGSLVAGAALALGLKGGDFLARKIGDRFGLDEVRVETSQSGQEASLLMGRYLSPDVYISYGVGLIDAVNTLRLRYEITDSWQLIAESGAEQSADLLYTFERGE